MSCDLSPDSFHVKKGGQRKYIRKAYEKSKQLAQRNISQQHPERYTLAMIADLESKVSLLESGLISGTSTGEIGRWLRALNEMFGFYSKRR